MLPLAFSHSTSRSYERLGYRLQDLIASPHVQKRQYVDMRRAADETEEDWSRLLNAIGETNGISIDHIEPGIVRIAWREYADLT